MRPLPLPTINIEDILGDCIAATVDPSLQSRMTQELPALVNVSRGYATSATQAALHLIPRVSGVGSVTADELKALYGDHMSSTSGQARWAYDILRNAAPHKRCPLCGVGTVGGLDHHLPKSKYPDLSVAPQNLVPACDYCNSAKRAAYPKDAGSQTIHPYFDDFTREQWLHAEIVVGRPVAITFKVTPPSSWGSISSARVESHFRVCKLGVLFASNANDELVTWKKPLTKLFLKGGATIVSERLLEEADRYAHNLNSWQHAMYIRLGNDPWFCGVGFNDISDIVPKPK